MENSMKVSQKKLSCHIIQLPHNWAYIWTKLLFKKIHAPHIHNSTIHNSQDMEITYPSIDRWMDNDVVQINTGILLLLLGCSVVSDSLRPYGLWPARLLYPWGFFRQEYWSGLPCPPGDLPDPGIEPTFLISSALAGGFFTSTTWEACNGLLLNHKK